MTAAGDENPIDRLRATAEQIRSRTVGRAQQGLRHDDADEDAGTFATDDAIGFDPLPMLRTMQETRADYVVIGQVAGILHGSTEPTGDLDLLWDGSPGALERVAETFAVAGVVLRDEDFAVVEPAAYPAALRGPKVYFEGLGCAGDLCTPRLPWGALDVTAFLRRKVWATDGSLAVPYLCLADLVTMRKALGGPKHARRVRELERLRSG